MLVALVAFAIGWAVSVLALVGAMDRQRRAHARREDLLITQLAHLAGKPFPTVREPFRDPGPPEVPELVDPEHWPDEVLA